MRAVLVGCGATKREDACEARDLYTGPLFTASRRYAEASGLPWLILSAKHGIIRPDRVIAPYDMTAAQRLKARKHPTLRARAWAWDDWLFPAVRCPLLTMPGEWDGELVIELHAGNDYARLLRFALEWGMAPDWCSSVTIEEPLQGLQIGERLRWYKEHRPSPPLERLRHQARELPRCPFCDVAAGWPCVDETGTERHPHQARRTG